MSSCPYFLYVFFQELFEVFHDKKELRLNHELYIAVLSTYTWSLFQFSFVRTATAETVADHDPFHETKKEVKNMRERSVSITVLIGQNHSQLKEIIYFLFSEVQAKQQA